MTSSRYCGGPISLRVLILSLPLILSTPAWADGATGAETGGLPEPWQSRFDEVTRLLIAEDWNAAANAADKLCRNMAESFPANRGGRTVLGAALSLRAMAEVGAEDYGDALWYWQLAQNVHPEARGMTMPEDYGEAAVWLNRHPLREPGTLPEGMAAPGFDTELAVPVRVALPKVAPGLRSSWRDHVLDVELVIDTEGRVSSPVVVDGGELPGKVYFTLEEIRRWQFRPATSGGRPVATLVKLRELMEDSFSFGIASGPMAPLQALILEHRLEETEHVVRNALDEALACQASSRGLCRLRENLLFEAMLLAGQEREADALWSWYVLANFYDDPGSILAEYPSHLSWISQQHPIRCTAPGRDKCPALDLAEHPQVLAPRPLTSPPVAVPKAWLEQLGSDRLVASIVVDAKGRVHEPRLVAGDSVAVGLIALHSLREWTFEPALLDGKPVDVVMNVSIPFVAEAAEAELRSWTESLDDVETSLRQQDWQGAFTVAQEWVPRIAEGIGNGGSDVLARALLQLALAEAGLGRQHDALWHWSMAQNLAVHYRDLDLSAYAAAGELLAAHRLRTPVDGNGDSRATSEAPRKVSAPAPRFPKGMPEIDDAGSFELIVDASGRPSAPLVLHGRSPSRLYAALEAMRRWRYEPSTETRRHVENLLLADRVALGDVKVPKQVRPLVKLALAQASSDPVAAGCYWRSAQLLEPRLRRAELGSTAVAAELLDRPTPPRDYWLDRHRRLGAGATLEVREPSSAIRKTPPEYPAGAPRGLRGLVTVLVRINEQGRVEHVEVNRGLHPALDVASVKAICNWEFEPFLIDGRASSIAYVTSLRFGAG